MLVSLWKHLPLAHRSPVLSVARGLHATKSQLFAKTTANQQSLILSHVIRARWSKGAVASSFVL